MIRLSRRAAQAICLAVIAAMIGALSVAPAYTHRAAGLAEVKLSLTHGAPRRADCHALTGAELARLPRQMRHPTECARTRLPVFVLFRMDGKTLLDASLPPSGISGDGPSRLYEDFPVTAGAHTVNLFLRDTARGSGYDYAFEQTLTLAPGQNLVIDFHPATGGFYVR